jgi:hypothetical protein
MHQNSSRCLFQVLLNKSSRLIRHWKGESKSAAYSLLALDPHLTAVGLNQLLDDSQPQTGATGVSRAVYFVEPLEYVR